MATDQLLVPDAENQYASITPPGGGTPRTPEYDQRGNLRYSDTSLNPAIGTIEYRHAWDNRLWLVRQWNGSAWNASPLLAFHDALGRRTESRVNGVWTQLIHDGDRVVEERTGNHLDTATLARSYAFGDYLDEPVAMIDESVAGSGTTHYYLHDRRYSVVALVYDDNGATAVAESYAYTSFGLTTIYDSGGAVIPSSALGNTTLFTGRRYDHGSQTYDYRARNYLPELGRFLQRDPAGYIDGYNLYAYVGNNPLRFLDPSGLYRVDQRQSFNGHSSSPPIAQPAISPVINFGTSTTLNPAYVVALAMGADPGRADVATEIAMMRLGKQGNDPGTIARQAMNRFQGSPFNRPFEQDPTIFGFNRQLREMSFIQPAQNITGAELSQVANSRVESFFTSAALTLYTEGDPALIPLRFSQGMNRASRAQNPVDASLGAFQASMSMVEAGGGAFLLKTGMVTVGRQTTQRFAMSHIDDAATRFDDVARQIDNTLESIKNRNLWHKTTQFQGNKVYQRDDLIDINLVDSRGRTNLERMQQGWAPIGPDGRPVNLHHMLQTQDGPIAEVAETFHRQNSSIIHINDNTIPSGINRTEFNKWRRDYWKERAEEISGESSS